MQNYNNSFLAFHNLYILIPSHDTFSANEYG